MTLKQILIAIGLFKLAESIIKPGQKRPKEPSPTKEDTASRKSDDTVKSATKAKRTHTKASPLAKKNTASPERDETSDVPIPPTTYDETTINAWQTQFADISSRDQKTQVIIGFDFGTAFTKVVIHVPIANARYAIPLNETAKKSAKYLLPSCLHRDAAGNASLIKTEHSRITHPDLKMRILDDRLDAAAQKNIVTYLALVLQKSRQWLLTEKQPLLQDYYLQWYINIGMPTANYYDDELKGIYCNLVKTAWKESTQQPQTQGRTKSNNNSESTLPVGCITAFPEFVAQIQSYIHSPQRQPGVHALVDVGASTIDATGFIVHQSREGENVHPILSKLVEKLGTYCLAQHRCTNIGVSHSWQPTAQERLPSEKKFAKELQVSLEKIKEVDEKFKQRMQGQIYGVLKIAHEESPMNRQWEKEEGVPLMLCGGGARVEFYDHFYPTELKDRGLRNTVQGNVYRKEFPELNTLEVPGLPDEDRDRLSVAYGLSFDALNIGEIMHPSPFNSKAGDSKANPRKCPKCNGTGSPSRNCARCGGGGLI